MPTLHLGELIQSYGHAGAKDTGQVGAILESKYGLYSKFADIRDKQISDALVNSLNGALETMFVQRQPNFDRIRATAFQSAMGEIEDLFRTAIDSQAYNGLIPGVPTQAARMGIRHSWKRPYRGRGGRQGKIQPGSPRASFFDTGLLSASFRAWVD